MLMAILSGDGIIIILHESGLNGHIWPNASMFNVGVLMALAVTLLEQIVVIAYTFSYMNSQGVSSEPIIRTSGVFRETQR